MQGVIQFDPNNAPGEAVRVMLIRDNDNLGGTPPTITDILEASSIVSLRNKNTPKRYTVLSDKVLSASSDKATRTFNLYHKFKMQKDKAGNPTRSVKLYWDGTGALDYTRGHYFTVFLGNTATAGTGSTMTCYTRVRFYDN